VVKWVERSLGRVRGFEPRSSRVKAETELAPLPSLVNVHHLRPRAGLVDPVSV